MANKHSYLILIEVPSTAPLYGESGLQTRRKVRVLCKAKANNSSSACDKASKRLDVPYNKLKALLVKYKDGHTLMESHKKAKQ